MKHTEIQREMKADDTMSTTYTRNTQHVKDRVNNAKSSGAERGTTLEELQKNVNQRIPEVTRNQTANDDEHRDELPQTRRRKAVSV